MTWVEIVVDTILAVCWTANVFFLVRLVRLLYIQRRYGGPDEYRIARFNRAFARFK